MRVLLAGGGSGGSAAPVIAVAEALRGAQSDARFLYVGTTGGPERALAQDASVPYAAVRAGRLRRYASWRNLTDPFLVGVGFLEALRLAARFRPQVAFAAGGFATVPPLLAARCAGARIVVHQQDVQPSLANRMLAPFASRITVAFEAAARAFPGRHPVVVGNPVRPSLFAGSRAEAERLFGLEPGRPVLLVTGGGTGALGLNQIVHQAAPDLVADCEIIHLTGTGKAIGGWAHPGYHAYDFISEGMKHALAAADVVVSRGGMSALAELAALGKASIVVPMPGSHQEANAAAFARAGAAVVAHERTLSPPQLVEMVRSLLSDAQRRQEMGTAARRVLPGDAADALARELAAMVPVSTRG
jgi:UDP-N-acetylglucosamine--N-acetylmuramyl-(pentapeptide) pyrophosphoryl-undecaprenol N-acetylglucosamine transferase